jgi:hypothetical protein
MGFLKISTSLHKRKATETHLAEPEIFFQMTGNGDDDDDDDDDSTYSD